MGKTAPSAGESCCSRKPELGEPQVFEALEDMLALGGTEWTRSLGFSVPGRRAARARDRRRGVASGDGNRNGTEKRRGKGTELGWLSRPRACVMSKRN